LSEIERYQQKAAELILDDEAWRGELEDDRASCLLNWILLAIDAAVERMARETVRIDLGEMTYQIADQARSLLTLLAGDQSGGLWSGDSPEIAPLLGPPLFLTREEGRDALARLRRNMSVFGWMFERGDPA
jgi:hypothetical protein